MSAQTSKVNLLPQSQLELSFWGKFLKWAVTTGRYIIILTELVVILAFLSRFKLDEDLRTLNEQINTQVGFLESQTSEMADFSRLQTRLDLTNRMLVGRLQAGETMDYVEKLLPKEVVPLNRMFSKSETTLTGATLNESAMGKLMLSFSQDPQWKTVDVTEITGDRSYGIRFTISAKK